MLGMINAVLLACSIGYKSELLCLAVLCKCFAVGIITSRKYHIFALRRVCCKEAHGCRQFQHSRQKNNVYAWVVSCETRILTYCQT
eukprot:782726-Pelagomonas_calceolata.AAC.8